MCRDMASVYRMLLCSNNTLKTGREPYIVEIDYAECYARMCDGLDYR